jgi:hypothetical protein
MPCLIEIASIGRPIARGIAIVPADDFERGDVLPATPQYHTFAFGHLDEFLLQLLGVRVQE